jgi:hypothetical protein
MVLKSRHIEKIFVGLVRVWVLGEKAYQEEESIMQIKQRIGRNIDATRQVDALERTQERRRLAVTI